MTNEPGATSEPGSVAAGSVAAGSTAHGPAVPGSAVPGSAVPGSRVIAQRLDALRGGSPYRPHTARTLAALTGNPGCDRRSVLDAAGIDKNEMARHLGFPARFGRSRFAITREAGFERLVKADHCAELVRVLRERLGFAIPEASYADLIEIDGRKDLAIRHAETRRLIAEAAGGEPGDDATGAFLDHPVLRLDLAGSPVYLEPEVIALRLGGIFHIVEIKSFAVIDGQADSAKLSATARQSAVHLIALRRLLAEFGFPPERVSHNIVLVCPENFSNQPTASMVDVRKQVVLVEHQLARMTRIDDLLGALPAGLTFDLAPDEGGVPGRPAEELGAALEQVPARYAPDCLSACELAYFCRHRAREQSMIEPLGKPLRDALGGVGTVDEALGLADGSLRPADDQAEVAAQLRLAHRIYQEAAAVLPAGDSTGDSTGDAGAAAAGAGAGAAPGLLYEVGAA